MLAILNPGDRPSGRAAFPVSWDQSMSRGEAQKPSDWFGQCVRKLGGNPDACIIDDHIACFVVTRWDAKNTLSYLCLHALVTTKANVEDVFLDTLTPCQYFRLEMDPTKPGPLFKEGLPHVHVALDGEPRFQFGHPDRPWIIEEFLEFLYRNYEYEKWLAWAQRVYCDRFSSDEAPNDDFASLAGAFNRGGAETIQNLKVTASKVKLALRLELSQRCSLQLPPKLRELIDYP